MLGIGRGVTISFAEAGCTKIIIGDINVEGLKETSQMVKSRFPEVKIVDAHVDISSETSIAEFMNTCTQAFNRVDYASNVAGVVPQRIPIAEVEAGTFDRVVGVNLIGVWSLHATIQYNF